MLITQPNLMFLLGVIAAIIWFIVMVIDYIKQPIKGNSPVAFAGISLLVSGCFGALVGICLGFIITLCMPQAMVATPRDYGDGYYGVDCKKYYYMGAAIDGVRLDQGSGDYIVNTLDRDLTLERVFYSTMDLPSIGRKPDTLTIPARSAYKLKKEKMDHLKQGTPPNTMYERSHGGDYWFLY